MNKDELRLKAKNSVRSMGSDSITSLSDVIRKRVEQLAEFKNSKTVASYVSTSEEVQTEQIIRDALAHGKRVIVPKILSSTRMLFSEIKDLGDLEKGKLGISEPKPDLVQPVPLEEAEIILVPLVAWDERGYRLGHGRGYFDAALSGLVENLTVGLGFECQRVERIPENDRDVPLKMIITENRVLRFG